MPLDCKSPIMELEKNHREMARGGVYGIKNKKYKFMVGYPCIRVFCMATGIIPNVP